jgi:hypothetical protein
VRALGEKTRGAMTADFLLEPHARAVEQTCTFSGQAGVFSASRLPAQPLPSGRATNADRPCARRRREFRPRRRRARLAFADDDRVSV